MQQQQQQPQQKRSRQQRSRQKPRPHQQPLAKEVLDCIERIVVRWPLPHSNFPAVLQDVVAQVSATRADSRLPPGTLAALQHELAKHFNVSVGVLTSTRGEELRWWELMRDVMMPHADCILRWALRADAASESRVAITEYTVPGDLDSGVGDFCHTYVLLFQHPEKKLLFCDVDGETLMESDAIQTVGNLKDSLSWINKCHEQMVCFLI